jgi:hypothetical protein
MKGKELLMVIALGIAVFGASVVYAGWGNGHNWFSPNSHAESARKFLADTSTLRNELMIQELELRQEYAKAQPDEKRLAALSQKADDLRAEIQAIADKHGLVGGMMNCGMQGQGMQHGPMGEMHQGMMAQGTKTGGMMCGCGMRSM